MYLILLIPIVLFIIAITIILLLLRLFTKKKIFGTITAYFWLGIILTIVLLYTLAFWYATKKLDKDDYYGEYIVNRNYFKGKQTDWQYNNFRFEIEENDSIYFHITDKSVITKTCVGKIKTVMPYNSVIVEIDQLTPEHHIFTTTPTVCRSAWSFYLVFNSPKFGNMFFTKGHWKEID